MFMRDDLPEWVEKITTPHGNHRRTACEESGLMGLSVPCFVFANLNVQEEDVLGKHYDDTQQHGIRNDWDNFYHARQLAKGRRLPCDAQEGDALISTEFKAEIIFKAFCTEHERNMQVSAKNMTRAAVNKYYNQLRIATVDDDSWKLFQDLQTMVLARTLHFLPGKARVLEALKPAAVLDFVSGVPQDLRIRYLSLVKDGTLGWSDARDRVKRDICREKYEPNIHGSLVAHCCCLTDLL